MRALLIVALSTIALLPPVLADDTIQQAGPALFGNGYGRTFADGSTEGCEFAAGAFVISQGDDGTWLYRVEDQGPIPTLSTPSCPATFSMEMRFPFDLWSTSPNHYWQVVGCQYSSADVNFGTMTIETPRGDRDLPLVTVTLEERTATWACPDQPSTSLTHSRSYFYDAR